MARAKLSSGRSISDVESHPKLSSKIIVELRSSDLKTAMRAWVSLIGFILGLVAIMGVTLYLGLSATLMGAMPTSESNLTDRVWVMRNTYVGGNIPPGEIVYGSAVSQAGEDGVIQRTLQGVIGTEKPLVIQVIAGPAGDVKQGDNGHIYYRGEDTGYPLNAKELRLDNEYLAVCMSGHCEPGTVIIVPKNNIIGEAKFALSPTGKHDIEPIVTPDTN